MQNTLDGGEAILQAFRQLGVDYVVSSPGSEWGPVWEALARQQVAGSAGPTYLSCWHETLAVNLAVGYTAVTGRVQAVLLHAGHGLLQGAIGIGGAQASGIPLLVLSGESLTYGEHPEFDPGSQWYTALGVVGGPNRLVEPLVKWANQATSPATLYESVIRGGEMAQREPAGPVYLSVPIETMLHEWTPPARLRAVPSAPKPVPSSADIENVAALLAASANPVILTESGGREPAGFAALVALAEVLAIPVVEGAVADFANFPKNHALHQGHDFRRFRHEADLVLVVRSRVPWYPPANRPAGATVVVIDESPFKGHMVYQNLQADLYLEGDVVSALTGLSEAVGAAGIDRAKVETRRQRWAAAHDERQAADRALEAQARAKRPIGPAWLCAALSEALPDAIFVDETTTHRSTIQRHVRWTRPQSYFRTPSGLGQGLGTALGVKLASPERTVVSLIGDGAFLYNPVVQSLGLSKEAKLPILIVVFNNDGYLAMKKNQLGYYPEGIGAGHGLFHGASIGGPDYAELAAPFGGFGRTVDRPDELPAAIEDCLAAVADGRTAIVNVKIDP